jgi:threonine synthase
MKYVSTRGDAPVLDFGAALLAGLAVDGGLYVPERWPVLDAGRLGGYRDRPYAEVATDVMWPFVEGSSFERDQFAALAEDAYRTFDHPAVVPLRRLHDGVQLAELFHGPTLSFKDVALQLVGRLFEAELRRTGTQVTILGATSGDTGSAAIEAVRGRPGIELVMLQPAGRVSEVQRRQMTTVTDPNVHNVVVDGTFDDCQDLVKACFADRTFRDRYRLAAVNSINWARVAAQVAYYVTSAVAAGDGRPVSFVVPTGNFGNVLAGHVARQMGAPIGRLVVATNANDILARTLQSGDMRISEVVPTSSPAMDIQVSSNFERLLFERCQRDGYRVAALMAEFRAEGSVQLPPEVLAALQEELAAGSAGDAEAAEEIRDQLAADGTLVDPHTAVGLRVGRRQREPDEPLVAMATAHPAKFGDAVAAATGSPPELPPRLAAVLHRPERYETLPARLADVQDLVARTIPAS